MHLPLLAELQRGKVWVAATLELAPTEVAPQSEGKRITPKAGSLTGFRMAPDFDAPLEDFKEYME